MLSGYYCILPCNTNEHELDEPPPYSEAVFPLSWADDADANALPTSSRLARRSGECLKIIAAGLDNTGPRPQPFNLMRSMKWDGPRLTEGIGLCWEDVEDLDTGVIRYQRAYVESATGR
ncbi:hypothetical protein GCM10027040_23750 [Halomonas shantousis]